MAGSGSRRRASDEAEGSRASSRRRWWSSTPFVIFLDFLSASNDPLPFQAHPLESGPRAGQSSPAGRLFGVV
jgi:hypothetical protein